MNLMKVPKKPFCFRKTKFIVIAISTLFLVEIMYAQTSCSLGDPVFVENFGSGASRLGASLNQDPNNNVHPSFRPADLYTYVGTGGIGPNEYSIMKNVKDAAPGGASWNDDFPDHTSNSVDGGLGYMYYCDASEELKVFYSQKITGLCQEIEYELSSWFAKSNGPDYFIDPDIKLIVGFTDINDDAIGSIVESNTGPIEGVGSNRWHRKNLVFTVPVGAENIYFMLKNNVSGVQGNDLAIDDIEVRPCGPQINIKDSVTNAIIDESSVQCIVDTSARDIKLTAEVPSSFVLQWQESVGGAAWTDLLGETSSILNYEIPLNLNSTHLIRLKFAHNLGNLSNEKCHFFSQEISYNQFYANAVEDLVFCDNLDDGNNTNGIVQDFDLDSQSSTILGVKSPSDFTVTYHVSLEEANSGTNSIVSPYENSLSSDSQKIYVRVLNKLTGCVNSELTFNLIVNPLPIANIVEDLVICDNLDDGDDRNGVVQNFNLESQTTTILGSQDPGSFKVSYHSSLVNAISGIGSLSSPFENDLSPNSQTIYVRVLNTITGCENTELNFDLIVNPLPIANPVDAIKLCDNLHDGSDTNGVVQSFDLESRTNGILGAQNPTDFVVTYHSSIENAVNGTGALSSPYENNLSLNLQTIYVRVLNTITGCVNSALTFDLVVTPLPVVNPTVLLKQCDDDTDGISLFNLTEANRLISIDSENEIFTYYLSELEAVSGLEANRIVNYINYPNPTALDSNVYTRIETVNGCFRTAKIDLAVGVSQIPSTFEKLVYTVCDDEFLDGDKRNGIATFDFSDAIEKIKNEFDLPHNFTITFYNDESDALSETNPIDSKNHRNEDFPYSQEIYVRIDSDVVNECLGLGNHITLNVEKLPLANPVVFNRQCDDVPSDAEITSEFDTHNLEMTILSGQANVTISYLNALGSPLTDTNGNLVTSPFPSVFRTATQTITVRVTNNATDTDTNIPCYDETEIEFITDASPIVYPVTIPAVCDNGEDTADGFASFDTSNLETTLLGSQIGMIVHYEDANGVSLPSPLPNPFITATQQVSIKVENPLNLDCIAESTIDFVVNVLPEFTVVTPRWICLNGTETVLTFETAKELYTYSWEDEKGLLIAENTPSLNVTAGGLYTLIARNLAGCTKEHTIEVVEPDIVTIAPGDVYVVDNSLNNTIRITSGNNNFEGYGFSLDSGPYQDAPFFENVEEGIHTVYVSDKNNCGLAQIEVSVISFPKYFTPNRERNSTWHIKGMSTTFYDQSAISIYDRFGRLLHKLDPNGAGWDGLVNGKMAAATDYWFSVYFKDTHGNLREKIGHFSLLLE